MRDREGWYRRRERRIRGVLGKADEGGGPAARRPRRTKPSARGAARSRRDPPSRSLILGLTWLIGFQLAGELTVRLLDVSIPGPVVGMLYLFVWLRVRRVGNEAPMLRAGDGLLRHLQLLFVPAGVGVTVWLTEIADSWLPILVAMLGSWLLALAVVGWSAVGLERALGRPRDDLPAGEAA